MKARSSIQAIKLNESRYCFVLSKIPKATGVRRGNIETNTFTAYQGSKNWPTDRQSGQEIGPGLSKLDTEPRGRNGAAKNV